jgi:hypothetical protein
VSLVSVIPLATTKFYNPMSVQTVGYMDRKSVWITSMICLRIEGRVGDLLQIMAAIGQAQIENGSKYFAVR